MRCILMHCRADVSKFNLHFKSVNKLKLILLYQEAGVHHSNWAHLYDSIIPNGYLSTQMKHLLFLTSENCGSQRRKK